jgi:hypothetical protein
VQVRLQSVRLTVGGLCILLATTAGCGAVDDQEGRPVVTSTPTVLDSSGLRLPIERLQFSEFEVVRLIRAQDVLTVRCMRRYGLAYRPLRANGAAGPPSSPNERRYGLTDPGSAAIKGYHRAETVPRVRAAELSADEELVLFGPQPARARAATFRGRRVPDRGCAGEAQHRLAGDGQLGDSAALVRINVDGWELAKADPRVQAVFGEWSGCMKRAGLQYADPMAANNDRRFRTAAPTRSEIATAVADVECKRQTNVVGVWFAVEEAVQRDILASGDHDVHRIERAKRDQLAAADRVLGR